MNLIRLLRKNIGTITAVLGFLVLCVMTFGNLGEIVSREYWLNVKNNLTSISFITIGLTCVQVSIKQGLAEQALQRGINTPFTTQKYEEHRDIIKKNNDKMIYLPYFLQIYNQRHTLLRKREFLINNGFSSETLLLSSNNKKLITEYRHIRTDITTTSIKWSTVEVVYNKNGRIVTLDEYRQKRIIASLVRSLVAMIGVTFLTGGLFFSPGTEPLWQKFVKLFTYVITIGISAVFDTVKEYEKGAFGIPNELDEINQIWYEFSIWEIPKWVSDEINTLNQELSGRIGEEVNDEQNERTIDVRTDVQKEQKTCEDISQTCSGSFLPTTVIDVSVCHTDAEE